MSGFCFRLADNNPMISWKSKKPSQHAKWNLLLLASQETLHLRALLRTMTEFESLKTQQLFIVIISSVLFWQKNPVIQRSKHIGFQLRRGEMNKGSILLEYIETKKNVADRFMKPMTRIKLNTFRKTIIGD